AELTDRIISQITSFLCLIVILVYVISSTSSAQISKTLCTHQTSVWPEGSRALTEVQEKKLCHKRQGFPLGGEISGLLPGGSD
ncbi:hypothetical protein Q7C36_021593, partial [Tachysurus vachellii]